MAETDDRTDWLSIPERVEQLFRQHFDAFRKLAAENPKAKSWSLPIPEGEVKVSAEQPWSPFGPIVSTLGAPAHLMGGPNPLTLAILGGVYGSGLGAGSGLGRSYFPEDGIPYTSKERKRAVRNYALMGLLAGVLPGLGVAAWKTPQVGPIRALLDRWPTPGKVAPAAASRESDLDRIFQTISEQFQVRIRPTEATKQAMETISRKYAPAIFEPAWRRIVLEDKLLSPPEKAAAMGFPFGACLAFDSPYVSPRQVGEVFAFAGGPLAVGESLGKIAACALESPPEVREYLLTSGVVSRAIQNLLRSQHDA